MSEWGMDKDKFKAHIDKKVFKPSYRPLSGKSNVETNILNGISSTLDFRTKLTLDTSHIHLSVIFLLCTDLPLNVNL